MDRTKIKLIADKSTKLMVHIIKRNQKGEMEDKTLWDHPVVTAKDICPDCKEIDKRDGHKWRIC